MIFKTISAQEKRKKLKAQLESSCLRFVGSFSPLVSRLIEQKGFDGIYVSGAVLSSLQGWPDVGLTSLTEVVDLAESFTQFSSLPSIVDADTGFGGAGNLARTVYELEKKGLSAFHIEDQTFPKRCGHLDQKTLISVEDMILKIKTAVKARKDNNFLIIARTDARGVEGLDPALERAKAYVSAGADIIFPEALQSVKEFEIFRTEISTPLMANMTEFGKTEIISHQTFKKLAYNVVIYPVSAWRLALKAVDQGLDRLFKDQQKDLLPQMQTRQELYKLLQYEDYKIFDKTLYNFSIKKDRA
ncbi:MAG: methylisocitrate lyase [Oligoflexia bacterium]|nr:methylisocitrate lyase [Oligoflexia bacterium]